jgi:hypothetical protein
MTGADRRERISAEIADRTGITEAMIERLVRAFYAKSGPTRCLRRCSRRGFPIGNRI